MRVCIITPYDLSADGGVNGHVLGLAAALRRMGDEVKVLGPASGLSPAGCDGLKGVIAVPANGSTARIGLLVRGAAVREFLDRGAFDLVHLHEPWVPGPARVALREARAPLVATFHAFAERERRLTRALRRLAAAPLSRLGRAIAVSESAAQFLRRVWAMPISIIPNGLDAAAFRVKAGARRETRDGVLRVLFVGRFGEPRKGLRVLLEAAALLRARGRAIEVDVVGEGPRHRFASLATRAGATFAGRLDDRSLVARYQKADVFCAPSTGSESFGLVLVEAMAAGSPVVASDLPGYAEAAAGAALLVPSGDVAAFADALGQLHLQPQLRERMRALGLARAAELDWGRVAAAVRAIYSETLSVSPETPARLSG